MVEEKVASVHPNSNWRLGSGCALPMRHNSQNVNHVRKISNDNVIPVAASQCCVSVSVLTSSYHIWLFFAAE